MERLSDTTLGAVLSWARKKGLVVFIDTQGVLSIYPKTNPAWRQLQAMLYGRHPEMKMYLIRLFKEVSDVNST